MKTALSPSPRTPSVRPPPEHNTGRSQQAAAYTHKPCGHPKARLRSATEQEALTANHAELSLGAACALLVATPSCGAG